MIYLDNASTTLIKPECVIKATEYALRNLSANAGRGSHSIAVKAASIVYEARKAVCKLVNADAVIFGQNCTDCLNTAIFGSARRGHVVTTVYEHNSTLRPLNELKHRGIIDYTVVMPDRHGVIDPDEIEKAIRRDTYLIAVNNISNVTGAVAPITSIGRIARRHGLMYLIDGAQSVGYDDPDMRETNCDMLCFAPHKGLHGPQGLGCLCIRGDIKLDPVKFGGTGTHSSELDQPDDIPEGFECGTMSVASVYALIAAINYHENISSADKRELARLGEYARSELEKMRGVRVYGKYNALPNIISFNIEGMNSASVGDILNEQYDIAVRCGLHCAPLCHKYLGTQNTGAVRASLSYNNTERDVEFFLRAIKEII